MVLSIPLVTALLSTFGEDEVLLSESIEGLLVNHAGIELDTIEIEKDESKMQVLVRLFSERDVPQELVNELGNRVNQQMGEKCSVRVVTLLSQVPR